MTVESSIQLSNRIATTLQVEMFFPRVVLASRDVRRAAQTTLWLGAVLRLWKKLTNLPAISALANTAPVPAEAGSS